MGNYVICCIDLNMGMILIIVGIGWFGLMFDGVFFVGILLNNFCLFDIDVDGNFWLVIWEGN